MELDRVEGLCNPPNCDLIDNSELCREEVHCNPTIGEGENQVAPTCTGTMMDFATATGLDRCTSLDGFNCERKSGCVWENNQCTMASAEVWNAIDCEATFDANTENIPGSCIGVDGSDTEVHSRAGCVGRNDTWVPGIASRDFPTGCPEGCTYTSGLKLHINGACALDTDPTSEYSFDATAAAGCLNRLDEISCNSDSNCIWDERIETNKCMPKTDSSCEGYFQTPELFSGPVRK